MPSISTSDVLKYELTKQRHVRGVVYALTIMVVVAAIYWLQHVSHRASGGTTHSHDWHRQLLFGYTDLAVHDPLQIIEVGCSNDVVYAACGYRNDSKATVTLEGAETADDRFWLIANLSVDDGHARWRRIGRSKVGGKIARETVGPGEGLIFYVDMTALKSLSGKYVHGHVSISTGDTAEFDLSDLSP